MLGRFHGPVGIRIEFDGQKTIIADGRQRVADLPPVHSAGAGDEVVMFPPRQVFEVAIPNALNKNIKIAASVMGLERVIGFISLS